MQWELKLEGDQEDSTNKWSCCHHLNHMIISNPSTQKHNVNLLGEKYTVNLIYTLIFVKFEKEEEAKLVDYQKLQWQHNHHISPTFGI